MKEKPSWSVLRAEVAKPDGEHRLILAKPSKPIPPAVSALRAKSETAMAKLKQGAAALLEKQQKLHAEALTEKEKAAEDAAALRQRIGEKLQAGDSPAAEEKKMAEALARQEAAGSRIVQLAGIIEQQEGKCQQEWEALRLESIREFQKEAAERLDKALAGLKIDEAAAFELFAAADEVRLAAASPEHAWCFPENLPAQIKKPVAARRLAVAPGERPFVEKRQAVVTGAQPPRCPRCNGSAAMRKHEGKVFLACDTCDEIIPVPAGHEFEAVMQSAQ
ncbi:MAG TPA: hypothetical protein VGZ47_08915 [Gemmataceae bacterium]|jgi:hypothetical protein|nr:hypothetical protein [Gemmataceae bacterium]